MPLQLQNLDATTRTHMVTEIDNDRTAGKLYLSGRLSATGQAQYPALLKNAAQQGDDGTLANALHGMFNATESRKTPSGGTTQAKIPSNAHETLAEGEFNRFYIRALCLRAIAEKRQIEVYRARPSSNPRPESQAKIGTKPDPQKVLQDIRSNPGTDTWLGLPPGPNSGLSVKLV